MAPDKIDEVEAGQPFHEFAGNFLLGAADWLPWKESTCLSFSEPRIIQVVPILLPVITAQLLTIMMVHAGGQQAMIVVVKMRKDLLLITAVNVMMIQ